MNLEEKSDISVMCNVTIGQMSALQIHCLNQTQEKLHVCKEGKGDKSDMCDEATARMSALQIHCRNQTQEKLHVCEEGKGDEYDTCDGATAQMSALQINNINKVQEKFHVCKACKKRFSLKKMLQRHMLTHKLPKLYVPRHCQKTFSLRANRQKHSIAHHKYDRYLRNKPMCKILKYERFFCKIEENPHVSDVNNSKFSLKSIVLNYFKTSTKKPSSKLPPCKSNVKSNLLIKKTRKCSQELEKPHISKHCKKESILKSSLKEDREVICVKRSEISEIKRFGV